MTIYKKNKMGNVQQKKFNCLVLGLKDVGKTHFLDKFIFNEDTTKLPTVGFYEADIGNINFVEYGSAISWTNNYNRTFDTIIMIIDVNYTIEQILEAKSAMIQALINLPKQLPLCILFKGYPRPVCFSKLLVQLQLAELSSDRIVSFEYINFDNKESWEEGVSKLIEWIAKPYRPKC